MSQQTGFSQKFFTALFEEILNFELSEESGDREKIQWKKYIIVCFTFNRTSIGLVEIAYKIFKDKLYGKTSRIFLNKFVRQDLALYNNFIKHEDPFDHGVSVFQL